MVWDDEGSATYQVIVDEDEASYSIWPAHREVPLGWSSLCRTGTREQCIAYIESVRTKPVAASAGGEVDEAARWAR